MSGNYCVLKCIDGRPFPLYSADGFDDAVDIAFKLVKADEASMTVDDESIRTELELDTCWGSNQGNVWVYILMTETYKGGCACDGKGRGQYHLPGCSLYVAPK